MTESHASNRLKGMIAILRGLSPQECARASQRFWRKHAHGPGSGLGLTMVQLIAHIAGGSLQLSPAAPGLQARLWLPAQYP